MEQTWDYVIVGSGFGGSVSAMRLAEKGYSVLVLEKGKRLGDRDFARSNLAFWKYLWAPKLGCHGVLEISLLKGMMVLHGTGVGGGSLGYANVLEVPNAATFATPAWNAPLPWGEVLAEHYATAKRMLGVTRNPKLWKADETLRDIAVSLGRGDSFRATEVGSWFGEAGVRVPDPYFGGEGPEREGCTHCGGCMVGCRHNAKNTLPKNYLWFAERLGAKIRHGAKVLDVRPLAEGRGPAGAQVGGDERYEVIWRPSMRPSLAPRRVRARNVIFAAGVLGTMGLLLKLRDVKRSLPDLSPRLGEKVRTNSESLLGSVARSGETDWSEGVAISSIFNADEVTRVEPVRYPAGSDLMRFIGAPLISDATSVPARLLRTFAWVFTNPLDFLRAIVLPGWAKRATILLIMQNVDNGLRLKTGRSWLTGWRRGLVAEQYGQAEDGTTGLAARVETGHQVTREFSKRIGGVNLGSVAENAFNLPTTAHILGGAPIGAGASEGAVDERFNLHNYPGLMVVDGSIIPANPGVNPSLSIAALAEYAMSAILPKGGA
ncbi:MAG TPA: FAD-dependent oxidoreductase [Rectinemataceae bacterium]|nr:FAD-dependent oxidoreductase [Rectinemataceae bacterium]